MSRDGRAGRGAAYAVLLSACMFLTIICACLLVALVLIGRNLAGMSCRTDNATEVYIPTVTEGTEISVRLNVNTSKDSAVTTRPSDYDTVWRLPRNVVPEHYNLTLNPRMPPGDQGDFSGTVNITLRVSDPIEYIIVHAQKLNITAARLNTADGEEVYVLDFHEDPRHELWVVDFRDPLPLGTYYLFFEFGGIYTNKIRGLYSSAYTDELTGKKRFIATSKFEPTYARQAFPCFDEPNFKAKYTVNLVKPKGDGYIALSNMNQLGEPKDLPDGNTQLVSFNTSVPMSTYLACFIVCDFNYTQKTIKAKHGNDVDLKVYATPAQQKKTQFALDVAANITEFYIEYFGIEYPLPKLDMIAIPDFVSGAMEHWGLVTYRETALLYDERVSSVANKKRVATVVAHELAHMWFGNLVTLDWWNDLWLNEGFATYMQFKSTDKIIPEWGLMDQFLIDELHPVLDFDATLASHPIVQTVLTPNEITEIFDTISYNKGASVLRMLENAVGEENFRQGISNYLQKYKYSNAVTKNLWDELQNVDINFNVQDVMDTWTVQMGYPIINVAKDADTYVLTQKRFLTDPENENMGEPSIFNYKWTVPITYITDKNPKPELVWFDKSKDQIKLSVPGVKWVKFNHRQVGYYRVNYGKEHWDLLAADIESMNISDRTHLLEESFSIAKSGQLSYDIPLNMTKYLKNERGYVPWIVAANSLLDLKELLYYYEIYPKFQKYVQSLVEPIYEHLTWNEKDDDTDIQRQTRSTVLNMACSIGHKTCLDEANKKFKEWLTDDAKLSQNTKEYVYKYGMVSAKEEEWQQVYEKFIKETDAQEKIKLMRGLASIKDPSILSKLITLAEDEKIVRGQDYFTCLQFVSYNPAGTPLIWDFVRENWEVLVNRFTLNDRYLGKLIPGITRTFTTKTKLKEMEAFFETHPDAGAGAISRKQALETVSNNIKWLNHYKTQVEDWLNVNVKN